MPTKDPKKPIALGIQLYELICHVMDQLAAGEVNSKSDRIYVIWVEAQREWEQKDGSDLEKGFELKTFMCANAWLYLYYYGVRVFGLAESLESDCCITYPDPRYPADDWIDEVLKLASRHAEYDGARYCFK